MLALVIGPFELMLFGGVFVLVGGLLFLVFRQK